MALASTRFIRAIRTPRYGGHFLWPPQCRVGFDCTTVKYVSYITRFFDQFFAERYCFVTETINGLSHMYNPR